MLKVVMGMMLVMTVVVFYHEDGGDGGDSDDGGDGETLEDLTCKKDKNGTFRISKQNFEMLQINQYIEAEETRGKGGI